MIDSLEVLESKFKLAEAHYEAVSDVNNRLLNAAVASDKVEKKARLDLEVASNALIKGKAYWMNVEL